MFKEQNNRPVKKSPPRENGIQEKISILENELKSAEEENRDKRQIADNTAVSLISLYAQGGLHQKGIDLYEKYQNHFSENTLDYTEIGRLYLNMENLEKALSLFQKMRDFSLQHNDPLGIGKSCFGIASVYHQQKKYDRAFEMYITALKTVKELDNKFDVGIIYLNIGVIHLIKGKFDKALEMYNKSLKINQHLGDLQGIQLAYDHLGRLKEHQGQYNTALEMYEKSLRIAKKMNDNLAAGFSYRKLTMLHQELEEFHKALDSSIKGYLLFKKLEVPQEEEAKKELRETILHLDRAQAAEKLTQAGLDAKEFLPAPDTDTNSPEKT